MAGIDGFCLLIIVTCRKQKLGLRFVLLNSTNFGPGRLHDLNLLAIDFLSRGFPKPQQAVNQPAGRVIWKKFAGFYAPARRPETQIFAFLR